MKHFRPQIWEVRGCEGYLNMFEGRGTCQFLRVPFSKKCRNYRYQFLKYVQN